MSGCWTINGTIQFHGGIRELASAFRQAGEPVYEGKYSVRLEGCDHFVFCWVGNLSPDDPWEIDADADAQDGAIQDATRVSDALRKAGIAHCLEVYAPGDELVKEFS